MPLTGITDLYGQRAAGYTSAGALETRRGLPGYGPADNPYGQPDKGQWGEAAGPAWAAPGWNAALDREAQDAYVGGFVLTDDTPYEGQGAGGPDGQADMTPYPATTVTGYSGRGRRPASPGREQEGGTAPAGGSSNHAAPYPRTWTQAGRLRPEPGTQLDDQWTEQESRRVTHEGGYGAGRVPPMGPDEPQFGRRDVYYQSQGHPLPFDPGTMRLVPMGDSGPNSARGNRDGADGALGDEVMGGGKPNGYGYGDAHVQNYRQQTDSVPFNYNWLNASERPFIPKGQATNMWGAQTLDGPDSPYGAMGDQTDYSAQTFAPAMVEGPATPYAAPPDPTLNTTGYADDGGDSWAWG